MVNFKNAIAFGLLASAASAASIKNDKRHVHHRRAKAPCTTDGAVAPFPAGNSTQTTGTGAADSTTTTTGTSTSVSAITYTVVPVPVTSSAESSTGIESSPSQSSASSAAVAPSSGNEASACGVATSYITVQQTVTVTQGEAAAITPSSSISSSSTSTSSVSSAATYLQDGGRPHHGQSSALSVAPAYTTSSTPAPVYSSSSSSASVSVPSNTPSGSSSNAAGSKLGACYTAAGQVGSGGITGVSWAYDWAMNSDDLPEGVEYVPTVHDATLAQSAASSIAQLSGVTWVKHLNEPDMPTAQGGSNLSPSAAASVHTSYVSSLVSSYKVGLPAVSSYDTTNSQFTGFQSGITWLSDFVGEVGCDWAKFADGHWYALASNGDASNQAQLFLEYVDTFTAAVDKMCPGQNLPIWFTEFSAYPTSDVDGGAASQEFLATVAPALEQNTRIGKYSYYFPSNTGAVSVISQVVSTIKSLV